MIIERTKEEVDKIMRNYSASNYVPELMEVIQHDLEEGLDQEYINRYVSRKLSIEQQRALSDMARSGVSLEYFNVVIKGFYSYRQIELLRNYYHEGITAEQVEKHITRDMSAHAMKKVLEEVAKHVPKKAPEVVAEPVMESVEETQDEVAKEEKTIEAEQLQLPVPILLKEEFLAFEQKLDQSFQALHEEVRKCIDAVKESENQMREYKNEVLEKQVESLQREYDLQKEYNGRISKDNQEFEIRLQRMEEAMRASGEEKKELQKDYKEAMEKLETLRKEKEDMRKEMEHKQRGQETQNNTVQVERLSFEAAAKHYEETKKEEGKTQQMDFVVNTDQSLESAIRVEQSVRTRRDGLLVLAGKKLFGGKIRSGLIKCVQDAKLSTAQMKQIGNAIKAGLTDNELVDLIKSGMEADKMEQMIEIVMLERQYQ